MELTEEPDPNRPKHHRRWLWTFLIIGAALRVPMLGDSIWFDESCVSHQRIGTFEQLVATIYVDIHPPLYITFMHVWNTAIGDSEWSMRIPPLLAGLLSIPLMFWCGRRIVGDTGALWAAALLALSPAHIWYSAEAGSYSSLVLCSLFAVYTFHHILVRETRSRLLWFGHIANVAVMLALHYYLAIYVVVLAGMAPLVARGFSRNALSVLVWHGTGILLFACFVYLKQHLGEFEPSQDYLRPLTPPDLHQLLFVWCWTGNTLHTLDLHSALAIWLPQGLAIGLVGLGFVQVLNQQRVHRLGIYLPAFALTIPGFLVLSGWAGVGSTFIERNCIPALPFVLLMVGAGLAALPGRVRMLIGGLAVALAAASVVTLYSQRADHWTVHKPNPDWRAAASWLGAEIDGDGAGRPVFTSMPNPRPLSYYDGRIQDVKNLAPPTSPDEIEKKVGERLGSYFGGLARDTFGRLAEHNQQLLDNASLRVYRSLGDPAQLELTTRMRAGDDVCYLVRNEWHPHVRRDRSVEDLLAHERVKVLEHQQFAGMSVYKVRITRQ